jgi:D-alanyl-D-alanine carboxypeptidase
MPTTYHNPVLSLLSFMLLVLIVVVGPVGIIHAQSHSEIVIDARNGRVLHAVRPHEQ